MRGELTEPVKPIVFYVTKPCPAHLRPYIMKGITDWNVAFEKAGFKNAVRVLDYSDSLDHDGKRPAIFCAHLRCLGESQRDGTLGARPRTGEILEADIIWWHNEQVAHSRVDYGADLYRRTACPEPPTAARTHW
jgi:hypothetical protein